MGRFTQIPQDTFETLQLDAGVLLNNFDPDNPAITDAAIVCATTGGIAAACEPIYSDYGEDVDNCPNNMKELKHLDGWNCTLGFTAIDTSPAQIKLSLGAADVSGNKITPRADLKQSDFTDAIWWVGDRADGGFAAVKLLNALSTSGFSLQTTKNGKGQFACTLTGHVSINAQKVVPMAFFSAAGDSSDPYSYIAITPAGAENPANSGWYERSGSSGSYVYAPTVDTEVNGNKTYYIRTVAAQS